MAQRCGEGQYMDRLLRECVSCSLVCHNNPVVLTRCSEYCVSWRCKAVSGQFYDRLLKKCLNCSEICGSHPPACSDACKMTPGPVGVSAVPPVTGRGRSGVHTHTPALFSEALLFSLLGVCVTVLLFTLTTAILMLIRRAKHQQDTSKQQHNQHNQHNQHAQSSKDSLMTRAADVNQDQDQDRSRATETCVYCFSDHTVAPHTHYQQAGENSSTHTHTHHPALTHSDKSRPFRIICSPTQTSM
ncbi:tumor necrosis factor receptor superfamily member 13B [Rhinichthys klamathensis goyatoka]|uniref:tumor necrosis factor receptor superfamily member 13B n=1 Tax=Rhinichthys klamathensis goyatoka TaxID=3034132 RepID=UPI0024B613DE|nr:tumor necrosis factor receptor superfamily member 13B [Rhinichthys klamathensis goyatoka]